MFCKKKEKKNKLVTQFITKKPWSPDKLTIWVVVATMYCDDDIAANIQQPTNYQSRFEFKLAHQI